MVTLKDWKNSDENVRYAFLLGFTTALEMEKEWQSPPLPLEQSLNNSWIRGLSGFTLKQINENINTYISSYPGALDRPLVDYLWYTYAQPKVREKVSRAKFQHAMELKQQAR